MYRPRLRSQLGCFRCKRRRVKCDEALPKCSFCARWDLECVRPARAVSKLNQSSSQKMQDNDTQALTHDETEEANDQRLILLATPAKPAPGFDPFHNFPITESQYNPVMAPILKQFFGDIAATYSHDLARQYFGLRVMFLADLHEDEAVFFSMVSYCAAFRDTAETKRTIGKLKLEAEKSTLHLLRQRIEETMLVTDTTVLAAIMHILLVTYDTFDGPSLRKMLNGVNLMAARTKDTLKDITVYMLLLCNVLCSLFNADEPCVQYFQAPERPHSFDSVYTGRPRTNFQKMMGKHLTSDVVMLFQDLDFVLFFRTSSEKFYNLTHAESSYIFGLLKSIDVQSTTLQVRHVGDTSLNEIAALGAILVKQEVVAYSMHQLTAIDQVLKRLQRAILLHPIEVAGLFEPLAMWSCFAALVGRGLESRRKWFSDYVLALLFDRHERGSLTHGWMLDLHLEMRQFPWHERMDVKCAVVCEKFSQTHMQTRP